MENKFKKILEDLENSDNRIKQYIAVDLKDYNTEEEAIIYLKEVCEHGGVSGMLNGLTHYKDTNKFYDDYEDEIETILEDYKDNCGYKNRAEAISNLNGDAEDITQEKNLLCWMAYEEIARKILNEDFKIEY